MNKEIPRCARDAPAFAKASAGQAILQLLALLEGKVGMQHRFVQIGFSLAIAAIFLALVILGTDAFIPHPDFDKKRGNCYEQHLARPIPIRDAAAPTPEEQQLQQEQERKQRECVEAVESQEKPFLKKVFIASMSVGAIGVAVSVLALPRVLPFAASGVTFGGLFSILYGIIRSAPVTDKRLMFIVVLLAFGLLLWVAWKRARGQTLHEQR